MVNSNKSRFTRQEVIITRAYRIEGTHIYTYAQESLPNTIDFNK